MFKIFSRFIQTTILYLATTGLYSLWEHYKKTGKDKPIEYKPFIICLLIISFIFYMFIWRK